MAHTPPPVPPDQRSPGPDASAGQDPNTDAASSDAETTQGLTDRRDKTTKLQSSQFYSLINHSPVT